MRRPSDKRLPPQEVKAFPGRRFPLLLAGAVPRGGFGSPQSLSAMGYKSPNEKLNIAAVGVGVRGPAILVGAAATENIVALCDVDGGVVSATPLGALENNCGLGLSLLAEAV